MRKLLIILLLSLLIINIVYADTSVPSSITIKEKEEPSPGNENGGNGGGGSSGGSRSRSIINFEIEPDIIKVQLKNNQETIQKVTVTNTGNRILSFTVENFPDYISPSETSFSISPGSFKTIYFHISTLDIFEPEVYLSSVLIKTQNLQKVLTIILEVVEKEPLFDTELHVAEKVYSPGDIVKADIKITNLGELKLDDVFLLYAIKDNEENSINSREETLAIEKELILKRELKIPEDAPSGNYIFYTRVLYGDKKTVASDTFQIRHIEYPQQSNIYILLIIIAIAAILTFFMLTAKKKKKKGRKHHKM